MATFSGVAGPRRSCPLRSPRRCGSVRRAEVTVEGELVGDYGFRGDGFMWTQLNDDSYARAADRRRRSAPGGNVGIGVRMPVDTLGRWNSTQPAGTGLRDRWCSSPGSGRYHDPDRGGESYLEVASLVVIEHGRRLQEGPDWAVFSLGIGLIGVTLVMWRHAVRDLGKWNRAKKGP